MAVPDNRGATMFAQALNSNLRDNATQAKKSWIQPICRRWKKRSATSGKLVRPPPPAMINGSAPIRAIHWAEKGLKPFRDFIITRQDKSAVYV